MKIGIAISLYDKFEELAILIDIIRKNWKGDYIISVCSNHPSPKPHIKNLDIDVFTRGDDINVTKDMPWMRNSINMRCRVADCIKKSCTGAIKAGADYVMHLHTDAWPLKEDQVLKIIKEMKKNKKEFAMRGLGFSRYRHDCPTGHFDDMFFIINSKAAKKKRFFDFNVLAFLPHRLSIHGVMSLIIIGRLGLENIYHYDNHIGHIFWDGKKHPGELERGRPSMYDPVRGMLHVDTPTFPKNYGKAVQAMYLYENGITKGKTIKKFLKENLMDKQKLIRNLERYEKRLDSKLRLRGFPILEWGRFGRTFTKKEKYLNAPFEKKLNYWFGTISREIWDKTIKKWMGVDLTPDYSFWPEDMEVILAKATFEEDYPDKSTLWFKDKKKNKLRIKSLPKFYKKFYKYNYKGM